MGRLYKSGRKLRKAEVRNPIYLKYANGRRDYAIFEIMRGPWVSVGLRSGHICRDVGYEMQKVKNGISLKYFESMSFDADIGFRGLPRASAGASKSPQAATMRR